MSDKNADRLGCLLWLTVLGGAVLVADEHEAIFDFIKKHPVDMGLISIVTIVCVIITIIININLKNKYKREHNADQYALRKEREDFEKSKSSTEWQLIEREKRIQGKEATLDEFFNTSALCKYLRNSMTYTHISSQ